MMPKLINGLSTLSKEEWQGFRKYILLYTQKDTEIYYCLSLLYKKREKFSDFNSQEWNQSYMPDLSKKSWQNTFSKLYLWLEEYIVYNNLKADKLRSGIELVKFFNRSGQYTLANSKAKQVQAILDANTLYSPEQDYVQYQLYYYQFFSDNPIKDTDKKLIIKLIDSYIQTRRNSNALLKSQLLFWNKIRAFDSHLFNLYTERLSSASLDPLMENLHKLINDDDLDSYYVCKDFLVNHKIDKHDDLFKILGFYLIYKVQTLWRLQKVTDKNELIQVFSFALENNILINDGKIDFRRFNTIVRTLGNLTDFEWTNSFIEKWGPFVNVDDKEGAKDFAQANNYFQHGKLDLAVACLHRIKTNLISSRSVIHTLAIKIYYDTQAENYDLLLSSIDRFESYIKRRKGSISKTQLIRNKNFISCVKLLLAGRLNEKSYEGLKPVNETKWILEKLKETNPL